MTIVLFYKRMPFWDFLITLHSGPGQKPITKHTTLRKLTGTVSRSHSTVIMQQSKVIVWSICLFSWIGRLTETYIIFHQLHTGSFPWHWICMNTNANSQHECTSTKDIWFKGGSTPPEMWHYGWCVENEPNYRSILMGNISPHRKKIMVIILCSCNITSTV